MFNFKSCQPDFIRNTFPLPRLVRDQIKCDIVFHGFLHVKTKPHLNDQWLTGKTTKKYIMVSSHQDNTVRIICDMMSVCYCSFTSAFV